MTPDQIRRLVFTPLGQQGTEKLAEVLCALADLYESIDNTDGSWWPCRIWNRQSRALARLRSIKL
jgi:hypothetical protein